MLDGGGLKTGNEEGAQFSGLHAMQALLAEWDFPYWLDSGSLLGVIRDGEEIAWDSDIDLGIWDDDVPRVLAALPLLSSRGYRVSRRAYRGKVYGFAIKGRREHRFRPIRIHVYFREGETAWSPQTVTYRPVNRDVPLRGFAPWPRLRMLLGYMQGEAAARREGSRLRRFWRKGFCFPCWTAVVLTRRRLDRRWWDRLWPLSALHTVYTWVVPARHFDRLEECNLAGTSIPVPSDVEAYLEARYGDWRTPVQDWCYWTDDGCLVPERPERIVPRLAEGGTPVAKKGFHTEGHL